MWTVVLNPQVFGVLIWDVVLNVVSLIAVVWSPANIWGIWSRDGPVSLLP